MKTYNCNIKIQAEKTSEVESIAKSLSTLASKLSPDVLSQLADVVSSPIKLAYAKKQLGID
jgi:hypothetical protein